jgi:RNA polymerase sigma-32 factor
VADKNEIFDDDRELIEEKKETRLPVRSDPLNAYLSQLRNYPVLSLEEERKITRLVYEDQDLDAVERLTVSNLRLVVKIATGYYNMYHNILDLIQEGNVGLLHAVRMYNPYKGTKFSTYAQFWIRAYIMKYIMDTWSIVRLGTTQGQRKLFYRLNREKRRLEQLGIYPAPRIIAQALQVKEEEVKEMEARLALNDVQLNSPVNDDGADTMMDLLASDEDIEHAVSEKDNQKVLAEKIKAFSATLNDKETCVLNNRLMTDEPITLEKIGLIFNISRERVRQIEKEVLKKARSSFNSDIARLGLWPTCSSRGVSTAINIHAK